MDKEIYKEEFTIGRVIGEAWKIYKRDFSAIFDLVLAVAAGKFLMVVLVVLFSPFAQTASKEVLQQFAQILDALIGMVLAMAIAWRVKTGIDGPAANFSESLTKGCWRWPAAILTDLLKCVFLLAPFALYFATAATGNVMFLALFFFLLIPMIVFAVYWFFSTYAVLLKNKSGVAALGYSKEVVRGRAGQVFGYALVLGLIVGFAGVLAVIPLILIEKMIELVTVYISIPMAFIAKLAIETIDAYYYTALAVFFINFDATKRPAKKALREFGQLKNK
ncbi:MAG: hypothetical protein MUD10_05470 [Candidatus Pacebacteria bacterium]|nr:hypothetical protein [Candidatus Paceibacterota bacterium]